VQGRHVRSCRFACGSSAFELTGICRRWVQSPNSVCPADLVSAHTHIYLRSIPKLDALPPCCTQHLNINKFSPHLTSLKKLLNPNTPCPPSIEVPSTNNPSCLAKVTHTPLRRRQEILLPMVPAVLSAVPQIQMRIGPRSQILLNGEESRTALLNVTTVSVMVWCLEEPETKSY
jgi:hypothetical protein